MVAALPFLMPTVVEHPHLTFEGEHMLRRFFALCLFVVGALSVTPQARAEGGEHRFAFVVGNGAYADSPLPTAANDAGLMAETLQAAGFDVVGARDLDADTFRQSYADFLQRVGGGGPQAVAFVYLSGYGVQYGPDTYYVPIGAHVSRPADLPLQAIRFSDLLAPLEALNIKARFFVADAAYRSPFGGSRDVPGGLGLIDPAAGSLIAYNAAPGTVVAPATKDYGLYAQLLSAEMRVGGLPPDDLFERLRLRVSTASEGREIPWHASKIDSDVRFFERGADAPALPRPRVLASRVPLRDLPVGEAYAAAIARDDLAAYSEFLTVYGRDPLAKRIRILLAARREARTWALTRKSDEPSAYWTYLVRYPQGPHAAAARARLARLGADELPPQSFAPLVLDVPPPEAFELGIVDAGPIDFDGRGYELGPPPVLVEEDRLAPLPPELLKLRPPPEPEESYALPAPVFVPLPAYINPPRNIARPRNNRFFGGDGDLHRPGARGDNGEEINIIVIPRPEPARRRGEDRDRTTSSTGRSEEGGRRRDAGQPDTQPTAPAGPGGAVVPPTPRGLGGAPLPTPSVGRERRRDDGFDNGQMGGRNGTPGPAPRGLERPGQGDRGLQNGLPPGSPNGLQNGSSNDARTQRQNERREERRQERRQQRLDGATPQPLPVPNGAPVNPGRIEHREAVRPGAVPLQPRPVPPAVVPRAQAAPRMQPPPHMQPVPHMEPAPRMQAAPRMEHREMERPHPTQMPHVEPHREMVRPAPANAPNGGRPGGGNRFDQRP